MRIAAKLFLIGVFACVGTGSATAQNLEEFFGGLGRIGQQQPRRSVIQAEWERMSPSEILCVDNRLRRNRRSVNTLIDRGIGPTDNRVAGIVSDCRAATDAAVPNGSAAAAQVTPRENAAYVINGLSLGGNVQVGSTNYLDYACAPSQRYAGFTACQRQTAERSRRRRVSESAAFLHSADGSAALIEQKLEPVVMDDDDARDEIGRLSESYGQARLLPVLDARGVRSGVIASWGTVSLQPLPAERRAALASGTDETPDMLVDSIGDPQRSAQLGLPIYQIGGGAGYIWAANWNGRGRGTLRVLAIDASKLPGSAVEAKAAEPAVATAEPPKPAETTAQPAMPVAPPAPAQAAKLTDPTPVAPPPKAAASAPTDIRVVGPPIELRPNVTAVSPATPSEPADGGNGLVIFLTALVVVLLGAVGYLWRKSRMAGPQAAAEPLAAAAATPAEDVVAPKSEKMDLPALVPAESPDSIAATKADMEVPKDAAIPAAVAEKPATL